MPFNTPFSSKGPGRGCYVMRQPRIALRLANRDIKPTPYAHGGKDPETRKLFECPRPLNFLMLKMNQEHWTHRPMVERCTQYKLFFSGPEISPFICPLMLPRNLDIGVEYFIPQNHACIFVASTVHEERRRDEIANFPVKYIEPCRLKGSRYR